MDDRLYDDVEVVITVKYKDGSVGARRSQPSGNPGFAVYTMKALIASATAELTTMLAAVHGDIPGEEDRRGRHDRSSS